MSSRISYFWIVPHFAAQAIIISKTKRMCSRMEINYQKLGRRIAGRRKELGLKQAKVCEMCELSDKYLSAIECARSIPSLDVLLRICDALETTPNDLLLGIRQGEDKDIRNAITEKVRGMNEEQIRLLHSFVCWLSTHQIP